MRPLPYIACILFTLANSIVAEARSESFRDVRAAFDELNRWLGDDQIGQGWHEFLKTDALRAELEKGKNADSAVVEQILEIYSSNERGLDRRRFVAVRETLSKWVSILKLPKLDELPATIRNAKDDFTPAEEGRIEQSRAALDQAIDELERYLAQGGEAKSKGWKEYLHWEDFVGELEKEGHPALKVLKRFRNRLLAEYSGLELSHFVTVRRAVRDYGEALTFSNDRFQQQFEASIDTLASSLEAYSSEPTHENAATVAVWLGWLERAGQVSNVIHAVRHHYSKPNLFFRVSAPLVNVGFEERINRTTPIRDSSSGMSISGSANTFGPVRSRLIPNATEGEIEILFDGTMRANTRAVNGPATILSSSVTDIDSSKRVYLSDHGFRGAPTHVRCSSNVSIDNILGGSAVQSRAWPRARASIPRSEARTARRTERRIEGWLNTEVNEPIADANQRYNNQFKTPLMRRDEDPGVMRFSSTSESLLGKTAQANTFQIAAFDQPPELQNRHDLDVFVHESYFNNYVEAAYGGTKLTDEKAAKLTEQSMGRVPEQFEIGSDDEPWSITFQRRQPITAVFLDGGYSVTIRGKRFTSGERRIGAMHVSAKYKFEMNPSGARRIRQGEIHVEPADFATRQRQSLTAAETAEKAVLKRRFDELFPSVVEPKGLELPGRWKKAGKLVLRELIADNGWIAMGWQRPKTAQKSGQVEVDLTENSSSGQTTR